MVAPAPQVLSRLTNTKSLIDSGMESLLPELVQQYPDQYYSLIDYIFVQRSAPWVEETDVAPLTIPKLLILFCDFEDQPVQISKDTVTQRYFSDTGKSLKNYYIENSYGAYTPAGEVYGIYQAPHPKTYYTNDSFGRGQYPNNSQGLSEDIINLAVNDIDLSQYDSGGDKVIHNLVIVAAGREGAVSGIRSDIWAHTSKLKNPVITQDGYTFNRFMVSAEYISNPNIQACGVDCHEFGHLGLGLTDLYDPSLKSSGAGLYSLMSYGSWLDNASTPCHLDSWSKYEAGFIFPVLDDDTGYLYIDDVETNDTCYQFTTGIEDEYFIIENRQKKLFDAYLPAQGIYIWKVKTSTLNNSDKTCYHVGLVQADGMYHLEHNVNQGDSGDSYPGTTHNRLLSSTTIPSNALCGGSLPQLTFYDVSDSGDAMTLRVTRSSCQDIIFDISI